MRFIKIPPPEGIYERIQRLLEKHSPSMEDEERIEVERELEMELRSELFEMGMDGNLFRLVLRDDDLLGFVPWVVQSDGREQPLSAFEAELRRRAASGRGFVP